MKVKYIALVISGLFSSGLWAATNNAPADIEKRLAQLEQRLINAEQRAADAEAKIQTLKYANRKSGIRRARRTGRGADETDAVRLRGYQILWRCGIQYGWRQQQR